MGSPAKTRNSYRLRTGDGHRNPPQLSSKTPPRIAGPRPRHRDPKTTRNRYRYRRYCVALLICLGLHGTIMTTAATAATKGDCPQYHAILKRYGLPPKIFGPIAYRESRCNFRSISAKRYTGYPDVGLLQIQGSWRTVTRTICKLRPNQSHITALTKPACHLRVAAYLWANGKGAGHWSIKSGTR